MRDYRRSAHTVHAVHCHVVFCTKYRKPVLRGEIGQEVRKQIQQICQGHDIEILAGHVRPDHVHLLLSIPPHWSPSRVMQAVKGKTSHRLLMDYRRLRKTYWGRHLWARGYFVASSGNVTDETIAEYIRVQASDPTADERFQVSD
jgi:putative transposase